MDDYDVPMSLLELTEAERRRIAASLMLAATMQETLGEASAALASMLLRARVLDGLED